MMKKRGGSGELQGLLTVLAMVCLLLPAVAGAAEAAAAPVSIPGPGRLSFGGRFSENAQEFIADGLVPVWSPGRSVLFANLRASFLENAEQELNAGLVFRHLLPEPRVILGVNAYYDTRWTEERNTFDQAGLGLEVLSPWVDLRANYYHPLTDEKVLCEASRTTSQIRGDRLLTTTTLLRKYEEAMEGYDVEAGVWLPWISRRVPTALFVGHYDFESDHAADVSGVRLRAESRVHPNITLDAEWYEDKALNRSDYFVGVRLHLPLDFWNGVRRERTGSVAFASRMGDMVNRDFRIRTILTGPVVAGQVVVDTAAPAAQYNALPPEPPAPAPELPPNCYLDDNGDVVCD